MYKEKEQKKEKMFGLKNRINFYLCICFLLARRPLKVATFPTHNFSSCNCILLQSCEAFNKFIDDSTDETDIKSVIENAVCFFDGFNIFVCCPAKRDHKRNVKEKTKLDYIDELTGLNCPLSFGNEYNYDEYLKSHDIVQKYNDHHSPNLKNKLNYNQNRTAPVVCDEFGNCGHYYNGHSPYDHHHHQHHHHHCHDDDDDDDDDNNDDGIQVPFFPHAHAMHHNHVYSHITTERTATSPAKKEHSTCGILTSVYGNNTEVYPWIVRLAYLNTSSRTIRYRCMGTVISDQHILTAAHCVDRLVSNLRLIYARIGDDTNFDDYQILETIVHPNYNEPLFNNDVAILRLAVTSKNQGSLKEICLPTNRTNTLSGDMGIVAGWSSGGISEISSSTIRYINLPIMNNTECAIRYAKYSENFETSIVITPTEFCAKAQEMNDVCEGDSGGPFMRRSETGRYTLLGIVAFGPKTNCGQSNLPGVYMRVSSYVDWIISNIQ